MLEMVASEPRGRLHAVGARGTLPLGWRLYVPEEWCEDELRRARAKIPASVAFQTKPALAGAIVEQAAGWQIPLAPILADQAYGDDSDFRSQLSELELEYVAAVAAKTGVYPAGTRFTVPARREGAGWPPSVARGEREPESVRAVAEQLPPRAWKSVPCLTAQ